MLPETQPEVALLSCIAPPDGFRFVRGVWITHDCNHAAITDLILPALCGIDVKDAHRRRVEARAALTETGETPDLLICAAGDRIIPGPSSPGITVEGIDGRRLHAKFGLLQYQHSSGTTVKTVAFVTSANITDSGLTKNREVLVFDDPITAQTTTPRLAKDLLIVLEGLAKDTGNSCLGELVRELRPHIRATKTGKTLETVTNGGGLLKKFRFAGKARRCVILSPPFAGATDEVVVDDFLAKITSSTRVELYCPDNITTTSAPLEPTHTPTFSPAAMSTLVRTSHDVHVYAVPTEIPTDDGDDTTTRPVHAKLFAFVDSNGTAHVLTGSANYTTRGLDGRNRELMIRLTMSETQLDAWLAQLQPRPCPSIATTAPPTQSLTPTIVIPEVNLIARFVENPGQLASDRHWEGRLTFENLGGIEKLTYLGTPVDCTAATIPFVLHDDCWFLQVWIDGEPVNVPILFQPADDEFWQRIASPDDTPDLSLEMQALLFDLRDHPVAQQGPPPDPSKDTPTGPPTDDGVFRVPLDQRLVVLARRRNQLRSYLAWADIKPVLDKYLEHGAERAVAATILATYAGPAQIESPDPLITALATAVPAFDQITRPS